MIPEFGNPCIRRDSGDWFHQLRREGGSVATIVISMRRENVRQQALRTQKHDGLRQGSCRRPR
jgi:hypothetical protein